MTRVYETLVRLYPADIRFAYGEEMVGEFDRGFADRRRRGRVALAAFALRELMVLFCDAAAERVSSLYSHRTFHGRCEPNLGQVRPPNMGKREWFLGDAQPGQPEPADTHVPR